jgi:hypothetical protein
MKAHAFLAATTLGILAATSVAAREIPPACRSDAASLCPGMTPGDHQFGKCMKAHEAQVSPGCKEAARAIRKAHEGRAHKAPSGGQTPTPAPVPQSSSN